LSGLTRVHSLKSSLNQDTLKKTSTDDVIRIAKKTDYDAIEFAQDKVEAIVAEGGLNGLVRLLKDQGVGVASVQGPEPFNLLSEYDFEMMIKRAKILADVARKTGTDTLVPVAAMVAKDSIPQEKILRSSAESLRRLAKACGQDIRLGVEFLGFANCSINTLEQAAKLVEEVNLPNVGLTVDTFHMYISGSPASGLGRPGHKIFLVHVNDSESGDLGKLSDANRVFLGEGVIKLKEFRDALVSASYNGYISLELLRPEYWESDAGEVARKGREGLRTVFDV
jgi:2-keto-myo-inositol isomerase